MHGHRLIGRSPELGELNDALERAMDGRGGALLLSGMPGIGKTRLASEVGDRAQAMGVSAHWGHCWEGGVAPPFWPWIQILRSMDQDDEAGRLIIPQAAERAADGFVVLDRLAETVTITAKKAPTLVVVDDLQWADASSVQAFAHVASRASTCSLLLVGTVRSSDEAGRSDLAGLARAATRVEVGALSNDETAELLGAALGDEPSSGLIERVLDACGGNPFYIRAVAESARHGGAEAFPASVRAGVNGQLDALDGNARAVIAAASALGKEFSTAALASVTDNDMAMTVEALGLAEQVGVVRVLSFGTRYAFVHDLVREAIYTGLAPSDRSAIHRRAAALAAESDDEFQATTRAHHALAALPLGDLDEAVALATVAGDRARDRLAFDEAARWYRRAFDAASSEPTALARARAELLLAEGAALRQMLSPRAEEVLGEAAAAADALGDAELLSLIVLAWVFRGGGADVRGPELEPWVRRALELLPEDDSPLRARLLGAAAVVYARYEPDRARGFLTSAVAMAAPFDDDGVSLEIASAQLYVHWSAVAVRDATWAGRAREVAEELERVARRSRHAVALANANGWRAEVAVRLGEVAEAGRILAEMEQPPFGTTVVGQIMASVHRAAIAGLRGDVDAMRAQATTAGRLASVIDTTEWPVLFQELTHRYVLGRDDPGVIADLGELAAGELPSGVHAWLATGYDLLLRCMLAASAAAGGDAARASILLPIQDGSWLQGAGHHGGHMAFAVAEVATVCDRPDLTEAAYTYFEGCEGQLLYCGGSWTVYGSVDHHLGCCARALGHLDGAQRHFEDAIEVERRVAAPHLEARSHLRLAELAHERGGPGDEELEREHVADGVRLCDTHELTWYRTCFERLGSVADPHPDAGPNRLVRAGETWDVTFAGRSVRLNDAKGLALLARLLSEPGREFHALDLVGAPELVGEDDGGPALDATAKEAYRRRLAELADDLEEARRHNDPERAARAEAEIDAVTDQLASAAGLGGRDRRASAQSERARVAATRNLRAVIERAGRAHPELGRHLQVTIRTGTYCSYQPDPIAATRWIVD